MPNEADVGVIVGRFQVHRLHDAHRSLIDSVSALHRQTVLVLGLSPARVTVRNPLDFEARKQMLLSEYPHVTVLYLRDEPDDAAWSKKLDALIEDIATPAQRVALYGGRDSFIAHYTGRYPTHVLEPHTYVSGAELRRTISKHVKSSEDFRAGVIWATANGYPRAFPTVDIAVWRHDDLLLVRKPTEHGWRFPGGFVHPSDTNLEHSARREVSEETGVTIDGLQYLGSLRVDDWRYRQEDDQIITTLFEATYLFGPVRPADDVSEARWFGAAELPTLTIVPEHAAVMTLVLARRERSNVTS